MFLISRTNHRHPIRVFEPANYVTNIYTGQKPDWGSDISNDDESTISRWNIICYKVSFTAMMYDDDLYSSCRLQCHMCACTIRPSCRPRLARLSSIVGPDPEIWTDEWTTIEMITPGRWWAECSCQFSAQSWVTLAQAWFDPWPEYWTQLLLCTIGLGLVQSFGQSVRPSYFNKACPVNLFQEWAQIVFFLLPLGKHTWGTDNGMTYNDESIIKWYVNLIEKIIQTE